MKNIVIGILIILFLIPIITYADTDSPCCEAQVKTLEVLENELIRLHGRLAVLLQSDMDNDYLGPFGPRRMMLNQLEKIQNQIIFYLNNQGGLK